MFVLKHCILCEGKLLTGVIFLVMVEKTAALKHIKMFKSDHLLKVNLKQRFFKNI